MISTTFKRIIRSGLVNFWRNRFVAAASILSLTITLFMISGLYLGANFVQNLIAQINSQVDVAVSFKLSASDDSIAQLKKSLELLPEVRSVTLSSREDELAAFKERHKDNSILLQSIDEVGNPFGARLSVLAKDPSHYESIDRFLKSNDQVSGENGIIDSVSFKKDIISRLTSAVDTSKKVGYAIVIILALVSVLVTFNTISLTIYSAREEINVMRLVGASNIYTRGPFMVEGFVAGLLSALLSLILWYPAALWIRNTTLSVYGGVDMVSLYFKLFPLLLLLNLVLGIILGMLASFLSTHRYLKA